MVWSWSFVLFLIVPSIILQCEAFPFPERADDARTEIFDPHEDNLWIFLVVLSIGSLISLVTVMLICGAGECCGLPKIYWFGRSRQQAPMSFDNPVAELGLRSGNYSIPLSQIDVRALELDPVVFEPLPTIHDLSPLSSSQVNSPEEGKYNGRYPPVSFPNQKTLLISAFASEDSELYAHDWFDEPYRNFQRNNIEFVREVGNGWFGEVLEAEANDIVPFAKTIRVLVKRLRQDASQLDQMRFLDESRVYRDANQGNVLKLLGHSIEKLPFLLFFEYCPQGDLKSYLISNVTRAESISTQGMLFNMALDIAKGLEWIISKGFKHPDLASRNCQVASEGRIVIGDYGLATQMYKDDYYWNSGVPIPLRWAAPETIHCTTTTIQTLKVTEYSNIFTFGVVLWEITEFAKLPYFELSDEEVITRVFADKVCFLGQPSLPYIPFKDELYLIMKSCWAAHYANRPTASTIVTQLEELLNRLQCDIKKDTDFESKWERLGRNSSSSSKDLDNRPRGAKKSVSFTGIQNIRIETESLSTNDFGGVGNSHLTTATTNNDLRESRDQEKDDDGDNDKWLKEMEDGGIAYKVMQTTQSVQDFMVLTHVEPSDIHGPESLMEIGHSLNSPSSFEDKPRDSSNERPEFRHLSNESSNASSNTKPNNYNNHKDNDTLTSSIEPSPSLSQENLSGSLFATPDSTSSSSQYENVIHNPNQSISKNSSFESSLLKSSNGPAIAVEVSTPKTSTDFSPNSELYGHESITPTSALHDTVSKLDAKCRTDGTKSVTRGETSLTTPSSTSHESRHRRRTSTPKRSASSSPIPPLMNDSNGLSEDVFEIEPNTGAMLLNESCSLSPISMKLARKSGLRSGELVTTIVGASDDLGLGIFQGVTSQLEDRISYFRPRHSSESDMDDMDETQTPNIQVEHGPKPFQDFKNSAFGNDIRVLAGDIKKGQPVSLTPRPLLCNGSAQEPRAVFQVGSSSTMLEADSQSSSWDVVSNGTDHIGSISTGSSWDVVSIVDGNSVKVNGNSSKHEEGRSVQFIPLEREGDTDTATTTIENDKDINAFWNRQIKSLSSAAEDTKSLLAMSLETAVDLAPPSVPPADQFVEDINLVNQELNSLVLEDLENESATSRIAESHHDKDGNVDVKLAFIGTGSSESTRSTDDDSKSCTYTAVEPWEDKVAVDNKIQEIQEQVVEHFTVEETEDSKSLGPTSSLSCRDFVPSTWNNSLTPVRPAIKSPCTTEILQHDQKPTATSLKKSVSFERQQRQIVYEYPPPPPPINDFEEDLYAIRSNSKVPTIPLHSSLDWDLTQEEMEFAQHLDDSDEDDVAATKSNPMDMYRISGFELEDSFKVRASTEPFAFKQSPSSTSTLGQLRHTRDKLKLNLNKGEASLLENDQVEESEKLPITSHVLDSGVGSSTTESPSFGSTDHFDNNGQKLPSNSSSS